MQKFFCAVFQGFGEILTKVLDSSKILCTTLKYKTILIYFLSVPQKLRRELYLRVFVSVKILAKKLVKSIFSLSKQ